MNPRDIRIESFSYPLPEERIAKYPLAERDACKLLETDGRIVYDHSFSDLPDLLSSDSMLVCNNTRVINARLRFVKSTGALIEIFCLEPHCPADYALAFSTRGRCEWQCLVGNTKRWKEGTLEMHVSTSSGDTLLTAQRAETPAAADNSRTIIFEWDNKDVTMSDIIASVGEIPIPPYLNRKSEDSDSMDYQTIYSHIDGSVAAPTAGLHFTSELMERIRNKGVDICEVTLHVGAGTFRPVKSECIGDHDMHSEFIAVSTSFIRKLSEAVGKRPVVAVGTTSVRTLESLYHAGCLIASGRWTGEVPQWSPYEEDANKLSAQEALLSLVAYLERRGEDTFVARTRIIIAPGYEYRVVDNIITNFHQPESTLLLLVCAFIGDGWRDAYNHALVNNYRFLSYGDACFLSRHL